MMTPPRLILMNLIKFPESIFQIASDGSLDDIKVNQLLP